MLKNILLTVMIVLADINFDNLMKAKVLRDQG